MQPYFIGEREEIEMADWVPEGCVDGRKMGEGAEIQSVEMAGKWAPGIERMRKMGGRGVWKWQRE